jgi:hypothetical protein
MNPNVIGWTPEREIERLKAANLRAWQAHGEKSERLAHADLRRKQWRAWAIIGWVLVLIHLAVWWFS